MQGHRNYYVFLFVLSFTQVACAATALERYHHQTDEGRQVYAHATSLVSAIIQQDVATVQAVCSRYDAGLYTPLGEHRMLPLHVAAAYGNVAVLKVLFDDDGCGDWQAYTSDDLETSDQRGRTPLFYALEAGKIDAACYLVRGGAQVYQYMPRLDDQVVVSRLAQAQQDYRTWLAAQEGGAE